MSQSDPRGRVIQGIKDLKDQFGNRQFYELKKVVDREQERRMELAEGDLMARRRKVGRILEAGGAKMGYGSLSVKKTPHGDLVVEDVDGVEAATINKVEMPAEDPRRVEWVQGRLDDLHIKTLVEL